MYHLVVSEFHQRLLGFLHILSLICTKNDITTLPSSTSIKTVSVFQDSDIITSLVLARTIALIFENNSAIILRHSKLPRFVPMTEFTVGTIRPNIEKAKRAAEKYIVSRGKSWKYHKTDKRCWIRVCKNREECDFRIRFNIASAGPAELAIHTPHTCPCITHAKFRVGHSLSFLSSNQQSRRVVEEDRHVRPKQLIIEEQLDRGNKINYQQAHRLREKLRTELFGDEILSFQKMPSLIKKMQSSAYVGLQVDKNSRFFCAWVLPKYSENSVAYLRHFGAMDGAHCKARHRLVLLAVTSLDADEEILILAWALVPQEDRANWLWFLGKIAPYLTSLQDPEAVIISDRLKGLASAVSECFPSAIHSYCSKHLYDNLRHSYGEVVAQKFWGCTYVKTESAFDRVLSEIKKLNEETVRLFEKIFFAGHKLCID